ncbi:hypothetical protein SteCoe_24987 [Stentor coeruleus]|uniref:Uncharacterized protein n=1 Tax=Stentor coeruleus TaxID=5963 RepID=A0A1R2BG99_9CILI|nr:hypothetical protein SteCoe_24987 [Stentor coeruleus]
MAEDFTYKILILGDMSVGKTSLLVRFCRNVFNQNIMQSSGLSFLPKEISIDGENVILALWDTAATEAFRSINKSYYRGAHGVIMVFDQSNIKTFYSIPSWITEAQDIINIDKPIFVLANKCDLTEKVEVPKDMIEEFCFSNQYTLFNVSAKTGFNVSAAFTELARVIHKNKSKNSQLKLSMTISENITEDQEDFCKC